MPKINAVFVPGKLTSGNMINAIAQLHFMLDTKGVPQNKRVLQINKEHLNHLSLAEFSATVSEVVIVTSGLALEMWGKIK